MGLLKTATNLTYSNALILRYLAQGYLNKFEKDDDLRRHKAIRFVTKECRRLLRKADFQVNFHYSDPELFSSNKNYFMVANHMSYMDILCLSSGRPSVFVTSVEMQNTPFLGDLASFGGSYFVERRDRSKVPGEVKDLARLLQNDFNVFVFPEGTSTSGLKMLPFKKALFTAAIEAGVDVLPICLRYEEINGEPFSYANHKKICWYDEMPFTPHFLKLMKLESLKVSVHYLNPISTKEFPNRKVLADQCYQQIHAKYFEGREHLEMSSLE